MYEDHFDFSTSLQELSAQHKMLVDNYYDLNEDPNLSSEDKETLAGLKTKLKQCQQDHESKKVLWNNVMGVTKNCL